VCHVNLLSVTVVALNVNPCYTPFWNCRLARNRPAAPGDEQHGEGPNARMNEGVTKLTRQRATKNQWLLITTVSNRRSIRCQT
jgi:hypothetical protein